MKDPRQCVYATVWKMSPLFQLSTFRFLATFFVAASILRTGPANAEADIKRLDVDTNEVQEESAITYSEEKPMHEERHACPFFYDARYPAFEGGLVNCTWYTSKSCCKRTEVTSVFSAMDPIYSASDLCRNYINYLMCFFCSPDQYKFYQMNKKAKVCLNYCEALYEECKSAGFNRTLIGEAYSNGTAFCSAQNFDVTEHADCFKFDPKVFGGSQSIHVWSFHCLVSMALLLLVFMYSV